MRLSHRVLRVARSPSGVEVEAEVGGGGGRVSVQADVCICTLPLGVLKAGDVTFDPALPESKREAIERLGFGCLNKVLLVFPSAFWVSIHASPPPPSN